MTGHGENLVSVIFDRHHKVWNAGESAGFLADVAAALVRDKVAHYPTTESEPRPAPLQPMGTRSSGRESCSRCGSFFEAGTQHVCPPGAPASGPEVFEAGFPRHGSSRREKRRRGGA